VVLEEQEAGEARSHIWAVARAWLRSNLRYAAALILPPVCLHCHRPLAVHGVLCATCWQGIDFIQPPLCDRLGHPLPYASEAKPLSTAALRRPPAYARARAVARFDGVMRELIHAFKYSDHHEAVGMFVRMLASAGRELLADVDVIMPVPLHPSRLRKRRYNQAAILASGLARATGKPVDLWALRRAKKTAQQANLVGTARRDNVAGAFTLAPGAGPRVAGRRVLLIDDVITTGSTLEACTHALRQGGVRDVDCLALALVTTMEPYYE
jgi:ComF family protein